MLSQLYSLWTGRRSQGLAMTDSVMVNVSFRTQQRSYRLDRDTTIGQLRLQVARNHGLLPSDVRIILGGSLLDDNVTVQASGVGMQSTLFAVHLASPAGEAQQASAQVSSCPGQAATRGTRHGDQLQQQDLDNRTSPPLEPSSSVDPASPEVHVDHLFDQYFVYCKLCKAVRPGRLRVRCSQCGDGAVLVDRGPGGWEDVMTPGRLTGVCQSNRCLHCTPEFYFKCSEWHPGETIGTAVALQHIRANRRSVVCITCEDVVSPVVVFPCESAHIMCLQCFLNYCTVILNERRFVHSQEYGYTLPCPAGCQDSLVQDQHHFCVLGVAGYARYKDFAAEECLLAAGGMYCPRQDCASGFMVDSDNASVICPHCRYVFCRTCRRPAHQGQCTPDAEDETELHSLRFSDPERAERAQWEHQTQRTIQETTKSCPGCGTRTERDGGCMHMRCARCGEDWCWLCVRPWDRQCQAAHWFG